MTHRELVNLIEQYRTGIEAELSLLKRLQLIATQQREETVARNFEAFAAEADARDRITRSLVTIDEGLRPVRKALSEHRADARQMEGYDAVAALHREASDLVARILKTDDESLQAMTDAELARRAAMSSLERGEMTLAAYRKVLAPPVACAALVNRRG